MSDPTNGPPAAAPTAQEERARLEQQRLRNEVTKLELEVQRLQGLSQQPLERQRMQAEIEKLGLELQRLKSSWDRLVGRLLPVTTATVAVAGLLIGIGQYHSQQHRAAQERDERESKQRDEHQKDLQKAEAARKVAEDARADELRREAAKPFWEAQLKLYLRATEVAGVIATSDEPAEVAKAEREFWVLYWGPLGAVEDATHAGLAEHDSQKVAHAMVEFGRLIKDERPRKQKQPEMRRQSLALAHAIRSSLPNSFSLKVGDPHTREQKPPDAGGAKPGTAGVKPGSSGDKPGTSEMK